MTYLYFLEDNITINQYNSIKAVKFNQITSSLQNQYSENDIIYTLVQLKSAEYISCDINIPGRERKITGKIYNITWDGHELLNSIRPKPVWCAVKQNAAKFGINSIRGIASLAGNIINSIATNPDIIKQIIDNIK